MSCEPLKTVEQAKAIIIIGSKESCLSITFQPVTCLGVVNYPKFYTDADNNEIDISKVDLECMSIVDLQDKVIPIRDFARRF